MESKPVYLRLKTDQIKRIDDLVKTRLYKDRQHFIELAVLREIHANEQSRI